MRRAPRAAFQLSPQAAAGRDAARQLLLDAPADEPVTQVLRMLEKRPLSAAYLAKALPLATGTIPQDNATAAPPDGDGWL